MSSPKLSAGRIVEPGAIYSVTTVTLRRLPILGGDAASCVAYEISECERQGRVTSIAWVVMPDHLHWLFELQQGDLATVMRQMKSLSARKIQASSAGIGPVWQAGYYDHRVRGGEDLRAQAEYILQNPVRAGLIQPGEQFMHAWSRYL